MMTGHNRNTRLFFWHDICKSFKGDRDFCIGGESCTDRKTLLNHLAFAGRERL